MRCQQAEQHLILFAEVLARSIESTAHGEILADRHRDPELICNSDLSKELGEDRFVSKLRITDAVRHPKWDIVSPMEDLKRKRMLFRPGVVDLREDLHNRRSKNVGVVMPLRLDVCVIVVVAEIVEGDHLAVEYLRNRTRHSIGQSLRIDTAAEFGNGRQERRYVRSA